MRGRLTRAPKIKDVRECRIILRFNKNFLRVELKFLDFRMYFTSFQIIDSFDYYSKRLTLSLSVVRRIILPPPHPSLVFFVFRLCKSSTDFYVKRRASETDDSEHVSSAKNAILYYASFHRRNSIATCEQLNSTERKPFASLPHHHHYH